MKICRNILFLFTGLLLVQPALCQDDSIYQLVKKLDYPVVYFATGTSGELFTINHGNQLTKYNSNGDSVGVFNDVKKYGKLSYVDAQNPWKTILYYEGFETILLLDKYLKVLGSINLRDKNIFGVKAVATSYDNNIWLFDERDMKIKKLDENGNLLMASVDLRQVFNDVPQPEKIIDRDGLLYLYDSSRGVYIFDYYGSFKTMLPFTGWKGFFVFGKTIYGFDDSLFYTNTPPLPVADEKPLPKIFRNADQISLSPQKAWVLKNDTLNIFNLK